MFSFQHIDLWSRCNYSTLLLIHLEKLSWILNNFCSRQVTEIRNNCSAFQILLQIFHIFRRFRWRTWWKLLNWIAAVQLKHSFTFLAKERVTIVTCCKVWLTQGHTYDLYNEGGRSRTSLKDFFLMISWENNKDCHITMPLSLKTMDVQSKGLLIKVAVASIHLNRTWKSYKLEIIIKKEILQINRYLFKINK